jgi:hypothetical protein
MATHDYVIDNQSAPAFRTDLNNALLAIVSQNSASTAPTTTYANMIWYDTANKQLKKRNEANSAWITLGTIDEGTGTFTPSGERALASQAQAELGSDNTTLMTPLRTEQHMTANALGWGQTWQDLTASRTWATSYQNTTGRPISVAIYTYSLNTARLQVSSDNSTWITVSSGGGYGNLGDEKTASTVVPNSYYYRYTNQGGNPAILTWAELR